jgi:hypothetical protein
MAASSIAMSGGLLRSAAPRLNSAALTHFVPTNKTRASEIVGALGDKSVRVFFRERLAALPRASLAPHPPAFRPYTWRCEARGLGVNCSLTWLGASVGRHAERALRHHRPPSTPRSTATFGLNSATIGAPRASYYYSSGRRAPALTVTGQLRFA